MTVIPTYPIDTEDTRLSGAEYLERRFFEVLPLLIAISSASKSSSDCIISFFSAIVRLSPRRNPHLFLPTLEQGHSHLRLLSFMSLLLTEGGVVSASVLIVLSEGGVVSTGLSVVLCVGGLVSTGTSVVLSEKKT